MDGSGGGGTLIDSIQEYTLLVSVLLGFFLIILGITISRYKNNMVAGVKIDKSIHKLHKAVILVTSIPLLYQLRNILDKRVRGLFLNNTVHTMLICVATIILPIAGLSGFYMLCSILKLWYTCVIALFLCMLIPYYIFTLCIDYLKFNMNQKIPILIDQFRSSFVTHNRINPALAECITHCDSRLGRVVLYISDCSDLNKGLISAKERLDNTWFGIFVVLLCNYRENGGKLISQLYKLSRSITRYNNIEKKKSRRLIWYEVFVLLVSLFSLPAVVYINKLILADNMVYSFNMMEAFTRIAMYSLVSLLVVRVLRRL